jgi:hypothetical protein
MLKIATRLAVTEENIDNHLVYIAFEPDDIEQMGALVLFL